MKNNIDKKSKEIKELKDYFNEIVPPNYIIRIQYNSSNNIDLFVYELNASSTKTEDLFGQWDVDLDTYKNPTQTDYKIQKNDETKSLEFVTEKLNWNRETFKNLYKKLNTADCIGICNRKPVEIEYGFSGMALLSFLVFDDDLTDKQKEEYSDDCTQMVYKENIVLQYGSVATGSLCTPEFIRKK
ncbi:MAG: hypothetical protein MUC59_18915 [Saprospiraceae bacterium]|nr:hypothetical protein [Saprospiraceae bacterium]